ncbi:MAG TPA: Flp pilus assembly protein CpaB [Rhizomicrobium sp.]|jgi:pilus assembly protein CpaB|nr:Flp pilus assembly protein CpaB [Rhizomicrobium sp.]
MNTQRIVVLGLALVAAGGAAFLVRGMLGGGTPKAAALPVAAPIAMSEVLVAGTNLTPGQALTADQVRWEKWPTASVDSTFITHNQVGSEAEAVKGVVVRAPILANQPIANTAIVHGDASGFMAATLTEGMRAISIAISVESGAGGFILPNDRVDVILMRRQGDRAVARTLISDLRVLAVDQTFKQDKDTRTVVGRTATLEVTPGQAEILAGAQGAGTLSLALRPLGDNQQVADAGNAARRHGGTGDYGGPVEVIRYGMASKLQERQQ